ncbi:MAG: tRNA lysidine(34) synthetase TilS [Bacteroidales bacterium]|nr:tRNA lysidine(34) synthetase TilS [Bacteroidales bacterium]
MKKYFAQNKMQNRFQKFINEKNLLTPADEVLLTVSGGRDSMAMLHLFLQSEYKIGVAHCNFNLRGNESDTDQEFVKEFCGKHKIRFYAISFETAGYAKENNLSIQMAARELRYNWFNKIANECGYSKIATAHNLNDLAETFFINLTRKSGIKGLTGIPVKNGIIIRPLLFAGREEINNYIIKNQIPYREDSSNAQTKYLRNSIRHNIIPEFEKISPNFLESVETSTRLLNESNRIYTRFIDKLKQQILREIKDYVGIKISDLAEHQVSAEIMYEIISDYGFTYDNARNIIESINNQPGLTFMSDSYKLIKDRELLIIKEIKESDSKEYIIHSENREITTPIKLSFSKKKLTPDFEVNKINKIASFDADKILFPLSLRRWKMGDYFYPFGMDGKKKLSDFFVDKKLSLIEKEDVWVLSAGDDIIWVVNYRSDNRFRITKSTKTVLEIESKS